MTLGQTLNAWALQLAPVTLVEPQLVSCLLFAFFFATLWRDMRRGGRRLWAR
jgi:hypothetical protein